ncbi:hypothetical protein [Azospirillum argentinense]
MKKLGKNPSSLESLHADLDDVRSQIAKLKAERAHTERLPCTVEEAIGRIEETLQPTRVPLHLGNFLAPTGRGPDLAAMVPAGGILEVLLWASADTIRAKLREAIQAEFEGVSDGISAPARAAEIQRIDAALLDLERVEEGLIERGEVSGLTMRRRPEADPRAVLGIYDESGGDTAAV